MPSDRRFATAEAGMAMAGFSVYLLLGGLVFLQAQTRFLYPGDAGWLFMAVVALAFVILPLAGISMLFFRRTRMFALGLLIGGVICWTVFLTICGPFLFGHEKFI